MTVAIRINDNYHVEELQGKYILDPVTDEVGDIDMSSSGVPYGLRQGMTWLFRDNFVRVDFWDALNADPSRVFDNREEGHTQDPDHGEHTGRTPRGTHRADRPRDRRRSRVRREGHPDLARQPTSRKHRDKGE